MIFTNAKCKWCFSSLCILYNPKIFAFNPHQKTVSPTTICYQISNEKEQPYDHQSSCPAVYCNTFPSVS